MVNKTDELATPLHPQKLKVNIFPQLIKLRDPSALRGESVDVFTKFLTVYMQTHQ